MGRTLARQAFLYLALHAKMHEKLDTMNPAELPQIPHDKSLVVLPEVAQYHDLRENVFSISFLDDLANV